MCLNLNERCNFYLFIGNDVLWGTIRYGYSRFLASSDPDELEEVRETVRKAFLSVISRENPFSTQI